MSEFVVFGMGRTGSSLLVSLLDSHPAICCEGEILNHQNWRGAWRPLEWIVRRQPMPYLAYRRRLAQRRTGCLAYGFYTSPTVPGELRVVEEWADQAALDSHFAAPHMAAFMGAMGSFGVTGTELWRYDVAEKSRLM